MKKVIVGILIIVLLFLTACNISGRTIQEIDSCSSLTGLAKDNCYFEAGKCNSIENIPLRDSCVAQLAKEKQDLSICSLVEGEKARAFCTEQIAVLQNDAEQCKGVTDTYWKDNCYYAIAVNTSRAVHCPLINDVDQREDCLKEIVQATNQSALCHMLNPVNADICLSRLAILVQKDNYLCFEIANPTTRAACHYKVAKVTNDKTKCDEVGDSFIKERCEEYFKTELLN